MKLDSNASQLLSLSTESVDSILGQLGKKNPKSKIFLNQDTTCYSSVTLSLCCRQATCKCLLPLDPKQEQKHTLIEHKQNPLKSLSVLDKKGRGNHTVTLPPLSDVYSDDADERANWCTTNGIWYVVHVLSLVENLCLHVAHVKRRSPKTVFLVS